MNNVSQKQSLTINNIFIALADMSELDKNNFHGDSKNKFLSLCVIIFLYLQLARSKISQVWPDLMVFHRTFSCMVHPSPSHAQDGYTMRHRASQEGPLPHRYCVSPQTVEIYKPRRYSYISTNAFIARPELWTASTCLYGCTFYAITCVGQQQVETL